jgi:predicted acyl esterase
VENGETAHTGVEDADRTPIHTPIVSPQYADARMLGALALISAAAALVAPAPHAAGADFTKVDTFVTMSDGVRIAVTYYTPAGAPPAGGWPAVMMFHGIGQTRNSFDIKNWSANRVAEAYLVPDGYAVLTFDARAHGESGGLFSLDGPRELEDTRTLFKWLATRPNVDPDRVGAFGVSLGGGMVWLAAVDGVPFAAIAVAATWTDLQQALAPQALVRAGVIVGFAQDIPQSRYDPELAGLLQDALAQRNLAGLRTFLAARSVRSRLKGFRIPTLMLQGRRDFAFDAEQALSAFKLLAGPKRIYFGNLGHAPATNPPDELQYYAGEVRSWFDRFVKGIPSTLGSRPSIQVAADPWTKTVKSYVGLPRTRTLTFTFARSGKLTAGGKIMLTSKPIQHVETFGVPTVRVRMSSRTGYAHLVAVLSAVRRDGSELVVTDGGSDTSTVGTKLRTITLRLPDDITSIPRGSRLRVTLAATSTAQSVANLVYLSPLPETSAATVKRVTLTLPVLRKPVSP